MTWGNRFRLIVGMIGVVVLAAVGINHLNDVRGLAGSTSATIAADSYSVGSPYAGVLLTQQVNVGDAVSTGDVMFVVDSAMLRRDVASGLVGSQDVELVDGDGNLIVRATADGVVTELDATQGSFVQSASQLATVQRSGSTHVQAEYILTRQQYARLEDGATVSLVLPDGRTVTGTAGQMSVTSVDNGARVALTVTSAELEQLMAQDSMIAVGMPLDAELTLRNEGFVTTVADSVKGALARLTGNDSSAA